MLAPERYGQGLTIRAWCGCCEPLRDRPRMQHGARTSLFDRAAEVDELYAPCQRLLAGEVKRLTVRLPDIWELRQIR